jgi:SGNH domain-containing protein
VWNATIEPECDQYREAVANTLVSLKTGGVVVIAARWAIYSETTFTENAQRSFLINNEHDRPSRELSRDVLRTALHATARHLVSQGYRVLVIGPVPELPSRRLKCYVDHIYAPFAASRCGLTRQQVTERHAFIDGVLTELDALAGTDVFRVDRLLCDEAGCVVAKDGIFVYQDTDHLNARGAKWLVPPLAEAFDRLGGERQDTARNSLTDSYVR